MNHRPGANALFLAIKGAGSSSLENVIEFGGALVEVRPGSVDVNGVDPGGQALVPLAQEAIAHATGAFFPWGIVLMADNEIPGKGGRGVISHQPIAIGGSQLVDSEIAAGRAPVR